MSHLARASIVVPSLGTQLLKYLVASLRQQTIKPRELVLVVKASDEDINRIEQLCARMSLKCSIIKQDRGHFTTALNIGKKEATGDIVIFTDEDAIAPIRWIEKYIKLHQIYRNIIAISSRDIYITLGTWTVVPTPDDRPMIKLYRLLIRPFFEPPHPFLKKYRWGVYVTRGYEISHGPCIPNRMCYSLPLRGVNMSFKNEYIQDVWFPEHPGLKRALGNEQYFGLQLILRGYDTIYVPQNPILHIYRKSLSRNMPLHERYEIIREREIMKKLIKELLSNSLNLKS